MTFALIYKVVSYDGRVSHRGAFCPSGGLSELEADEAKVRLLQVADDRDIARSQLRIEKVPYAFAVEDRLPAPIADGPA